MHNTPLNIQINYGECHCGCGEKTIVNKRTYSHLGWKKGEPRKYLLGHNSWGRKKTNRYKIDKNGCWIWQLSKNVGYGRIRIDGKKEYRAHRYYYEKYKGIIPQGMQLDHLCRNRACVNPEHLEVVTNAENSRRGKRAKLNWKKVGEIRELNPITKRDYVEVAKKYGVDESTIRSVVYNKSWNIEPSNFNGS